MMNTRFMASSALYIFFFIVIPISSLAMSSEHASIQDAIANTEYLFCIDGGGSKTSLQIVNAAMEPVEIEHQKQTSFTILAGSTNINFAGFAAVEENLRALLTGIKIGPERRELSEVVAKSAIILGIGGLLSNSASSPALKEILVSFGFVEPHIALFADSVLAKQVISGEGAILIAGTGSMCVSKTSSTERRFGGLGYALGDEGSGFYIGKLALQEALREEFEGKPFILTEKVREIFDASTLSTVVKPFYAGEVKPATIASITPLVFAAAYDSNDKRCQKIIRKAAKALSKLVARASKERKDSRFTVYLLGGIFKNDHASAFIAEIKRGLPSDAGIEFVNISQKNIAVEAVLNSK